MTYDGDLHVSSPVLEGRAALHPHRNNGQIGHLRIIWVQRTDCNIKLSQRGTGLPLLAPEPDVRSELDGDGLGVVGHIDVAEAADAVLLRAPGVDWCSTFRGFDIPRWFAFGKFGNRIREGIEERATICRRYARG